MVGQVVRTFARHEEGAIAPLYALALFGLIGMAGVGFDYARVMALDTELQNAADQAALAAATQLDGETDSIQRAKSAATNTFATSTSAFVNVTRLATIDDDGDGNTRPITSITYKFWKSYTVDAPSGLITDHGVSSDAADAKVVEVTIGNRLVQYALTPIVGAIAGRAGATAMATMNAAYCEVPPLMFCLPPNSSGGVDLNFPTAADKGKSMRLHMTPNATGQGDDAFSPGNFGFLEFPYDGPTGAGPNSTLGWSGNNPNCTGESVRTRTGVRTPESGALNTRFDIDAGDCSGEAFCPSQNTTKDYVFKEYHNGVSDPGLVSCGDDTIENNSPGWLKYSDVSAADVDGALPTTSPGYQEDTCFANNSCPNTPVGGTSVVGDGTWNFSAYMTAYYGSTAGPTNSTTHANPSRYDVYKWEIAQESGTPVLNTREIGRHVEAKNEGKFNVTLYCEYRTPIENNAFVPNESLEQKDRRILTVAAVDCTDLNGKETADIIRYVDLFLVKPSDEGGADKAFFTEIVGEAKPPGTNNGFQGYAKRKAVLIR